MRIDKTFFAFILILGLMIGFERTSAQCSTDDFMDKCSSTLGKATYIKSFEVKSSQVTADKPNQFSYVFSKGSTYTVIICDQNAPEGKMTVNLYDRDKKLIISNYVKKTKKHYPSISYACTATGVYYIESFFDNDKANTCGVNILGYSK